MKILNITTSLTVTHKILGGYWPQNKMSLVCNIRKMLGGLSHFAYGNYQ